MFVKFIKNEMLSIMNKIFGLLLTAPLLFFAACSGSPEESTEITPEQQETVMVADSISIEIENMREDIEQILDELESLLDEIE